jgi:hypothetical protein
MDDMDVLRNIYAELGEMQAAIESLREDIAAELNRDRLAS